MRISLVISTLGRFNEVQTFLKRLTPPTSAELEVVIVDQNDDDRLAKACQGQTWPFPLTYLHEPTMRGVCRGRNFGAHRASGELICFPDDDCTYPPDLLERVLAVFSKTRPDILTGRAADETGRSINGRFQETAQWVTRENAFQTSIEWMMFFRREVFDGLGGFSEDIGPGSGTPWMANEGQDIVLRALAQGYRVYFDPTIYGHHPVMSIERMGQNLGTKARGYGRGMGYVLGRHRYPLSTIARMIFRPAGASLLFAARLDFLLSRYYACSAYGRLEGYVEGSRNRYAPPQGRR